MATRLTNSIDGKVHAATVERLQMLSLYPLNGDPGPRGRRINGMIRQAKMRADADTHPTGMRIKQALAYNPCRCEIRVNGAIWRTKRNRGAVGGHERAGHARQGIQH